MAGRSPFSLFDALHLSFLSLSGRKQVTPMQTEYKLLWLVKTYWISLCCLVAWNGKSVSMFSGATGALSIQVYISLLEGLLNISSLSSQKLQDNR